MRRKRIKEFVRFLKDNGVFKAFTNSYDPIYYFGDDDNHPINSYLRDVSDDCAISEAFTWSSTEQGANFWGDINNKWDCYVYSHLGGFDYV